MNKAHSRHRFLAGFVGLFLLFGLISEAGAQDRVCEEVGCAKFSYRLASVDSQRGVLLNALVSGLLNSNVSLTVAEWENLARADIQLLEFLQALDTQVGAGSTDLVLEADVTLLTIIDASAAVLQTDGNTAAVSALNSLRARINLLSPLPPIRLGDLLQVTTNEGSISGITINLLDLLYGSIALFNYDHVLVTPNPVTISAASVGLGSIANDIELYAQVSEPPVYACGGSGTQFYSAAVRVKLNVDLIDINLTQLLFDLGLVLPPDVSSLDVSLGQVELYADVARAAGTIQTVDAISGALTIDADPAVADLYLGQIDDNVFFTRSSIIDPATDLNHTTIGELQTTILGIGVTADVDARAFAEGNDPLVNSLLFNGPYPENKSVGNSATFISNLVSTLLQSLELEINANGTLGLLVQPVFDTLVNNLIPVLTTALDQTLIPILSSILSDFVDPLLEVLGIRIGEADVLAGGITRRCFGTVAGYVYDDGDHSGERAANEEGTGLTLYAKLINAAITDSAAAVASVNAVTGKYIFRGIIEGDYYVVIDDNQAPSDITPFLPPEWVGTERPSGISRTVDLASADFQDVNFGLYHGSNISGTVFYDNGTGGGVAHNGRQENGEPGLSGIKINLTTGDGATIIETMNTNSEGFFKLWIPHAQSGQQVRVAQVLSTSYRSVSASIGTTGGNYQREGGYIMFTPVSGTLYDDVLFGNIRPDQFSPEGQQYALAGSTIFYRHIYVAGTKGEVIFQGSGNGSGNWTYVYYRDTNGNGVIESGDPLVEGAITVNAGDKIHMIAKVQVPAGLQKGIKFKLETRATLALVNSSLENLSSVNDLTIIGDASGAGMLVEKEVSKESVAPGETVTYTIIFKNKSTESLEDIMVHDSTPAYTVFESASNGTLPAGLTCTITDPGAGNSGDIVWNCTGSLLPGDSGTVKFDVKLK